MLAFFEKNNSVKHILVEKTDRLVPNFYDHYLIERLIVSFHVTLHLEKENGILNIDSRPNEKFIFGINALMAKSYIDNLSEEIKEGMTEEVSQGIYPARAPYGYVNFREVSEKSKNRIPQQPRQSNRTTNQNSANTY